ncbi:MAG: oligosaccharide flippase family protein [Chitinophagales bacterium]|nr:oligosaccharide flippase family protein [Chitinophagales bacterium]
MGVIIKQSSLGLIANYLGVILGFVNVMLIMPFILSAEEIGLINLILSVVLIINPFFALGAVQIQDRYFTHVKEKQEIFNFSLRLLVIGTLLFTLIFLLGKPLFIKYYEIKSPEIVPYFWWIYIVCFIMNFASLTESYSTIHNKYHVAVFSREILYRILIFICLTGFYFHFYNFKSYTYLHFVMYGLSGIAILLYLYKQGTYQLHFKQPQFSPSTLKDITKFGALTILTGLASIIAIRVDLIMLGSMSGLKDVGIYTIAMFMASVIEVPRRTVIRSALPIIRTALNDKDISKVAQIQFKSVITLTIIGGYILTLIIVNLHSIYAIIPNGEIYKAGFFVVLLIGISKIVDNLTGLNDNIIISSKYYGLTVVFIMLLAIISATLNYLFIPIYGISGAAISTLMATVIVAIIKTLALRLILKEKIYNSSVLFILIFFTLVAVGFYFFPTVLHPIFSIILKSSLVSILLFLFLKYTKISPDINRLANYLLSFIKLDKYIHL